MYVTIAIALFSLSQELIDYVVERNVLVDAGVFAVVSTTTAAAPTQTADLAQVLADAFAKLQKNDTEKPQSKRGGFRGASAESLKAFWDAFRQACASRFPTFSRCSASLFLCWCIKTCQILSKRCQVRVKVMSNITSVCLTQN